MEKKRNKAVFITTKNTDYIRNVQELKLLREQCDEVNCIGSNASNYVVRLVYIYWVILWTSFKQFDRIFIGFAPQLVLPFWKWKFHGKHLEIDFFISVYDTMVCDRQKISRSNPIAKLMHWLDGSTLKCANAIIGDTKAHVDYFAKEFDIPISKFNVLYLEADSETYYPHHIKKREEFKNSYVVLYFGSVLPLQGVPVVVEAINRLKENKDIYFWVIGPLGELTKQLKNPNVKLDEWLSQSDLSDAIASADLCLAGHFNAKIDKADRTIPGKAYIYEKMEKPMILGDTKANHELFSEDALHFFVERGSGSELAQKILEVKDKYGKRFD